MGYDYQSPRVRGVDLVVPMNEEGLVCFVNSKDLIGWKILFFGSYEQETNAILKKYVRDTDIVVEAGANIGSESVLLSRYAAHGHVYCFEPNPYSFERLEINIRINELKNVSAFETALGEKDDSIRFHIYPKSFYNSGMSSKYMDTQDTREITVKQSTLDTFVQDQDLERVDFIKMDIQGAEMDLILGAAETIRKFRPKIFTEACEPYNDTKKLFEKLSSMGYRVSLISGSGLTTFRSAADVKDGNWLAEAV